MIEPSDILLPNQEIESLEIILDEDTIQFIENVKREQEKVLSLKNIDYELLRNTYINI